MEAGNQGHESSMGGRRRRKLKTGPRTQHGRGRALPGEDGRGWALPNEDGRGQSLPHCIGLVSSRAA